MNETMGEPLSPFVREGMFEDKMKQLAQRTSCDGLKGYLKKVLSYPVLKFKEREEPQKEGSGCLCSLNG